MKHVNIQMGICVLVLIALLWSAGCTSQPAGNTPAQQPAATQSPAATVSTSSNTNPSQAVVVNGTPDPWANFVAPTESTGANVTQAAVSETRTPEMPATPVVIVTEIVTPTPVPTTPSVNDTCSNIGGNSCLPNETCSGAYIRTTDNPKCCAGVCQSG
jgi:hypothetical protein